MLRQQMQHGERLGPPELPQQRQHRVRAPARGQTVRQHQHHPPLGRGGRQLLQPDPGRLGVIGTEQPYRGDPAQPFLAGEFTGQLLDRLLPHPHRRVIVHDEEHGRRIRGYRPRQFAQGKRYGIQ